MVRPRDGLALDVATWPRIPLQDYGVGFVLRGLFPRTYTLLPDATGPAYPLCRQIPLRYALLATAKVSYVSRLPSHMR